MCNDNLFSLRKVTNLILNNQTFFFNPTKNQNATEVKT